MPDTLSTSVTAERTVNAYDITEIDGWVVVSIWTPAKYLSTKYTYEHFAHLVDAVAHHNGIRAGNVRDHEQHGIFPAKDGLPIGPPLDLATILSVTPVMWEHPTREAPCTPENKRLAERAIANGILACQIIGSYRWLRAS
jgi:hypothetical protein